MNEFLALDKDSLQDSKIHFELPDKPNDPVPKVVDSMEGTVMWGVSLAAREGECNIGLTYSVENTTYV